MIHDKSWVSGVWREVGSRDECIVAWAVVFGREERPDAGGVAILLVEWCRVDLGRKLGGLVCVREVDNPN